MKNVQEKAMNSLKNYKRNQNGTTASVAVGATKGSLGSSAVVGASIGFSSASGNGGISSGGTSVGTSKVQTRVAGAGTSSSRPTTPNTTPETAIEHTAHVGLAQDQSQAQAGETINSILKPNAPITPSNSKLSISNLILSNDAQSGSSIQDSTTALSNIKHTKPMNSKTTASHKTKAPTQSKNHQPKYQPKPLKTFESDPDDSNSEEDEDGYCKGGYCEVTIGQSFEKNRYTVLRKLGFGHFSTVWLVRDSIHKSVAALKIVKAASQYTEAAQDEINMLLKVQSKTPSSHIVTLHTTFQISSSNGTHIAMVFEVLGPNLLHMIQRYNHRGIPSAIVKRITKQVLKGLAYLHDECSIIHTDLKPENILVVIDVDATIENLGLKAVVASDECFGRVEKVGVLGTMEGLTGNQKKKIKARVKKMKEERERREKEGGELEVESTVVQVEQVEKVEDVVMEVEHVDEAEVMMEVEVEDPDLKIEVKIADLGNACYVSSPHTSDIQTRQYRSPEVILGQKYDTSTDIWSLGCIVFELLTGDFLFDAKEGSRFGKDDDHLALISELVGDIPRQMQVGPLARDFFTRKGGLRRVGGLRYWRVDRVLVEKYGVGEREAEEFREFLEGVLQVLPGRRGRARDILGWRWFDGVDV